MKTGTDGAALAKGEEGGGRRAPWIETASDEKALAEIWKREVPGKPGPVDFGAETVIFLVLGVQSTGGYAIEPIAVDKGNIDATVVKDGFQPREKIYKDSPQN